MAIEQCVFWRIRRLSRIISRLYDAALSELGITATQFALLAHMDKLGPVGMSELARTLDMDASTLTRNLRPLLDRQWAQQLPGKDYRQRLVALAPEGRRCFVQARPRWEHAQRIILDLMGHAGRDHVVRALDWAHNRLTQSAGETASSQVSLPHPSTWRTEMIIVLARLKLKEGSDAAFVEVAQKLAEASRAEPGSAGYELLREGEARYSFLERYVDEAAVEAHRKTEHFRTLGRELGAFLEEKPEIIRLHSL